MKRIRFERQAIKQTAGRRVVAIEKRAIGARAAKIELMQKIHEFAEAGIPVSGLADEIAFMLRNQRFPRVLYESRAG